jgi:hypothetical protein
MSSSAGTHPGEELPRGERLGDIVISTDLQADDLVYLAVLCREHDDRHLGLQADLPAHLRAGEPRQHEIEQDQVGASLLEQVDGEDPVTRDLDLIALAPQHEGQRLGERLLVLDDQKPGHGPTSPMGMFMTSSSRVRPSRPNGESTW